MRVPWTARRSNQSILEEINPEYSLEGLMLKLQYFWPPDAKRQLIGKDLDVGKDRRQKEKGVAEDEMAADGITNSIDMSLSKLREIVTDRGGLHAAVHGVTKSWTRLSN